MLPSVFTPPLFNHTEKFYPPRVATVHKAAEIAAVVNAAFAKGDVFKKPGCQRTSKEEVEADIKAGRTWYIIEFGNEYKKEVAAAILYTEDSKTTAAFHMLAALPRFHGCKKAAELIAHIEKVAREQGKLCLHLSVANLNPQLIKYYEGHGYQKTGNFTEYFPPNLQKQFLRKEYQGYNGDKPKLMCLEMCKQLKPLTDKKPNLSSIEQSTLRARL